ncbi:2-octaprenyl-6-methoxyphenyl hydroxylase [Ferrimonas balearica]|uniref:2-octaprenyl-6-methoxyphenyl hydroxylase n=1 Tax=Ferrimonas balearica TaxID=44012 RepID=UPI001C9980E0|nr:2-octaprenyl-6-methoxyphenyl hydroxylase [Ferrimonas balearica]MBY5993592.1 2-octaprenyl-6-methoxyphenyl hydroxylase [Ferrimonas balearica]
MAKQYDIAIIGGAMAGASLALALANQRRPDGGRWSIALVEAQPVAQGGHPGYDSRAIALAEGSVRRLDRLALWPALAPHAQPIQSIQVSDRGHFGGVTMSAEEYGVEALGQVVELERVGPALWQALARHEGLDTYCPDGLAGLTQHADRVDLTLDSGARLSARLVVGADGTGSRVRAGLGLALNREPYPQTALIANITAEDHPGIAFERFTEQGPLALLPMVDRRYSLVWVQAPDEAERRLALSKAEFLAELQSAFGYRLGALTKVGQRASYPLALCRAEQLTHHRAVLVGNAAQTVHPIAGQGFNLGLRDVEALADRLQAALLADEDPGAFALLSGFAEARAPDRDRVTGATDALVKIFSSAARPLALGRNLGLLTLALFPDLKAGLAKGAMGWHGGGAPGSDKR